MDDTLHNPLAVLGGIKSYLDKSKIHLILVLLFCEYGPVCFSAHPNLHFADP